MKPLRDKFGRFVSLKDVGKKEIELAIRLYNEPDPVQSKDALAQFEQTFRIILILVAIMGITMWMLFKVMGR